MEQRTAKAGALATEQIKLTERLAEMGTPRPDGGVRYTTDESRERGRILDQLRRHDEARTRLSVSIKRESMVYGPSNLNNSWALDMLHATTGHDEDAADRLARNAAEVRQDHPKEFRAMQRNAGRGSELRAIDSTSGSFGDFVTPNYLLAEVAQFRPAYGSYLPATTRLPLPDTGLAVHVPSFTSGIGISTLPDNSSVLSSSPTGLDEVGTLAPYSGSVAVSQQLFDRGGLTGMDFDSFVLQEANLEMQTALDVACLTVVIAGAQTLTNSQTGATGANIIQSLYSDSQNARQKIKNAVGTAWLPTHVFTNSLLGSWLQSQIDSEGRPLITPSGSALQSVAGDPDNEGYSGVYLPGNLSWYFDDNLPASGSNAQWLVGRPATVLTWTGDPITFAFPETYSSTLSVLIGVRSYFACVPRFPSANVVVSGARYPESGEVFTQA